MKKNPDLRRKSDFCDLYYSFLWMVARDLFVTFHSSQTFLTNVKRGTRATRRISKFADYRARISHSGAQCELMYWNSPTILPWFPSFCFKKNCHETVCIRPYVLYTSGQFLAGVLPAHFQYTSISNTLLIYIRFASGIVPVFFWFIKYVFNSGPPDLHSALHPYLNDFMLEIYKFRFQHACNFFKKLVSIWYEKLDLCLYKPGHFHESTTSFPMWHSYIWCASAHRLPSTRTQSPYFITQLSRWWWRVIRYRTEGVVPV